MSAAPAPVEVAVAHHRVERRGRPGVFRAGGHHVGMSEEHEQGRPVSPAGPQVAHLAERQRAGPEAERTQALGEEGLAARVVGGDRGAPDERPGELKR